VRLQVRFFERVKLERRIRRLEAAAQAARAAGGAPPAADAAALAQAQDDLQVGAPVCAASGAGALSAVAPQRAPGCPRLQPWCRAGRPAGRGA
jgi:hypothetical protein